MGFYEEISEYYDIIFPTGSEQVAFLVNALKGPSQKVLDIACGTGGYSIALSKKGHILTGVDLDPEMIKRAKDKGHKSICFEQMDMMKVNQYLDSNYDLAYCIGNSLVHLPDNQSISEFLKAVNEVIKEGGTLVLQIINFDRILDKGITSLPTLIDENVGLKFERNYYKNDDLIMFNTILTVKGEKMENTIPLFPLRTDMLLSMLDNAGFKNVKSFGDFKETPYDKQNSFMLVIEAIK